MYIIPTDRKSFCNHPRFKNLKQNNVVTRMIKKLRETIRIKLFLWIFKILHRAWLPFAKKIFLCTHMNSMLINDTLKDIFKYKYELQGNKFAEKLALVVSLMTEHEEPPKGYEDFHETEKDIISSEVKKSLEDPNIAKIHLQNLRLLSYAYSIQILSTTSNDYMKKAKLIDPDVAPITYKEFNAIYKNLKKKIKERNITNKNTNYIELDISFDKIKKLIGLSSILFLCTGIFYNQLFLRFFGVDVSKFFSLNDYLSTSIDKIYITITSLAIGLGIGVFLNPSGWREQAQQQGLRTALLLEELAYYSFILMIIFLTIICTISSSPERYPLIGLLVAIVSFHFLVKITRKYFKNSRQSYIYLMILTIFLITVVSSTMREREEILKADLNDIKKYTITFTDKIQIDEKNIILLASNSNYYFFLDKNTEKTHIIPADNVISIETKSHKERTSPSRLLKLIGYTNN